MLLNIIVYIILYLAIGLILDRSISKNPDVAGVLLWPLCLLGGFILAIITMVRRLDTDGEA